MCSVVSVLQGLLTPAIAVIAVYVACQQWRTARNKLRLELFDRRFVVYEAVRDLVLAALQKNKIALDDIAAFQIRTLQARFLFDEPMETYLQEILEHAERFMSVQQKIGTAEGEERQSLIAVSSEHFQWLHGQLKEAPKRFGAYLTVQG